MNEKINTLPTMLSGPKKRVLFVITQSEIGGAQKFLLELLPHLNSQKYEIGLAVGEEKKSKESELTNTLENYGFKIFYLTKLQREISSFFLKDWLAVFQLRRLIREFSPDTLFLNSSKAGFIGSLASIFPSKIHRLKIIYRIGGWTFNDPWPWWKKRLWIVLEKISAKWKDLIIVNNQHDLTQAHRLKITSPEKLKLIHNGFDPYRLKLLEKEEAKIMLFEKAVKTSGKIFQAKIIVGTIANLYPTKGLKYLIEATSLLKEQENLIFFIIGDGPERAYLEKLIEIKNLKNKVFVLGHMKEASQYLSAFDIFLLPSVKEGFPWAILEAMSAKLPVIATRVGAIPEIIENGKNGLLVEPAHPEQITQKIQQLLANDHLRQEIGLQAHQTVLFKFSLEKMIKEIESTL